MTKIHELSFKEFVQEFWPCQDGGTWYEGSEIIRDGADWCIERATYECLSIADTGILLGERDPYELWNALQTITAEFSTEDVKAAIKKCNPLHVQCCYEDDPRNSNYWADFDGGDYQDDGLEDDNYIWHRANGVMTNKAALNEWAAELAN